MSEAGGANLEIAHRLNEKHEHSGKPGSLVEEIVEILEAIVLAIVAIATAYSGYQASLWDGRQGELYGKAVRVNTSGAVLAIRGGQEQLYDTVTFSSWLNCKSHGEEKLAQFIERRFRAEYRVAFDEWMKLDPIHDATAPPSPSAPRPSPRRRTAALPTARTATRSGRTGCPRPRPRPPRTPGPGRCAGRTTRLWPPRTR